MGNYFRLDILLPCVALNQDVVADNESLTWVKNAWWPPGDAKTKSQVPVMRDANVR